MRFEDCEKGMMVVVNPESIRYTTKRFSSNSSMERMKGKEYMIESLSREREGVRFRQYIWDPRDLRPRDVPDPEPIIFHFDESKL